jgi:hypothetical protein
MPKFVRGGPPGPGRPKGDQRKLESEREYLRSILTSDEYRTNFSQRLLSGKLAPPLEAMAWDRGFGKVREEQLDGELVISWRVPARLEPAIEAVALPEPTEEPEALTVAWRRNGA